LRPWRWQVTRYRLDESTPRSGVRDRAVHLADDVGWSATKIGATVAAARRAVG
jgi:hypothetical protein